MTALVDSDTGAPPVLVTSLTELHDRPGGVVRGLTSGALVVLDNDQIKCRAALMVGPQHLDAVLAFLGVDPATLPEPGTVRDQPEPEITQAIGQE